MKQKKTNLILSCLVLLAAVFAELYCFFAFSNDVLMILGTGVIILVAAYLALDSALSLFLTQGRADKEEKAGESKNGGNELSSIAVSLKELEKVQKASYILLKKSVLSQRTQLEKLSEQTQQQTETMIKVGKLVIKYNKESEQELASLLRELLQKPQFDEMEIVEAVTSGFQTENQQLEQLLNAVSQLKESMGNRSALLPSSNFSDSEPVTKNLQESVAQPDEELTEAEPMNDLQEFTADIETEEASAEAEEEVLPLQEEAEDEPTVAMDTSDPNKMMSADDIADLLSSMGDAESMEEVQEPIEEQEEEIEKEIEEEIKDQELQTEEPQKEELPLQEELPMQEEEDDEPTVAMDTSDPNKMMSADDIAALLSSMGDAESMEEVQEPIEEQEEEIEKEIKEEIKAQELQIEEPPTQQPSEEEPQAEPAPAVDMSDPNKMMSADDIAALLASMGQ